MGVISEVIPCFSRRRIYGYKFVAFSSLAIAVIGFFVWGHHMFVSSQSVYAGMVFSFLTFFVAIPTAIKVLNWTMTMYKGSVSLEAPMLYAIGFLGLFVIGGMTGLFLSTMATDIHLHDTYFVVAHFHYVMMGSTLIAFIGGVYYWWPKMFGKMYNEILGRIGAVIVFVGFNLTFFPMFIVGSQGMPRRYANYAEKFQDLNILATIGAYILATGLFMTLFYLLASLKNGKKAPRNPWGGATFEWLTASPPPHHNFDHPPKMHDPYDYHLYEYVSEEEGYKYTPDPRAEWAKNGTSHDPDADWMKDEGIKS